MKRILLIGVWAVALPLGSQAADSVKVTPPQNKALTSIDPGQRYVFGQISEYRRDQYLLDTKTGRLWQKVCTKSGEKSSSDDCLAVLQVIPFITPDDKYSLTPQ